MMQPGVLLYTFASCMPICQCLLSAGFCSIQVLWGEKKYCKAQSISSQIYHVINDMTELMKNNDNIWAIYEKDLRDIKHLKVQKFRRGRVH